MKAILCSLLLAVSGATSAAVAVGPFPAPAYADTDVSTNFPFSVRPRRVNPLWNLVKVTREGLARQAKASR